MSPKKPITSSDVVYVNLTKQELDVCIDTARHLYGHIVDRNDLHKRDDLERFNNVLMGEVAEQMVIKWLRSNGKTAVSAVDKTSASPDLGHDISAVRITDGADVLCSVKSSISCLKDVSGILKSFKLATKKSELRDINVQVYFWLTVDPPKGDNRVTVPTLRQSALIGWFGSKDIDDFTKYNHEQGREVSNLNLEYAWPMSKLLDYLR